MKKLLLVLSAWISFNTSIKAQACFNPGDGSDGVYTATTNTTITGGTYNFTSFNIDPGVIVTVTGTQPLTIRCTGAVTINGTLSANGGNGADGITYLQGGIGGIGVAGGGNGGDGTYSSSSGPIPAFDGAGLGGVGTAGGQWSGGGGAGYSGLGTASGNPGGGFAGPAYGDADITGLEAGSGGGGGSGGYECGAGGGGAGGGLIVIMGATSITIGATGIISANGGNGGSDGTGNCGGGGGGSGGSIWIASPSVTHNGLLLANGGMGGASNVAGSPYYGTGQIGSTGRIRVDYDGTLNGSGTASPAIGSTHPIPVGTLDATSTHTNVICNGGNEGSVTVTPTGGSGVYTYSWSPFGGTAATASNLAAGTYTCTISDGCFITTETQTVSEPAVITQTNTVSMCPGDSYQVGPSTYTTAGSFVDVLFSVDGCDSTVTTNITLLNAPDVSTTTNLSTITAVETGASYQWIDCNTMNNAPGNSTSQSYTATNDGDYAVIIDNGTCSDTSACVTLTNVGVIENNRFNEVTVFPNPNNGNFNIRTSMSGNFVLQNELGQVVMNFTSNDVNNHTVTIEHLSNGVYFIQNNEMVAPIKIVVAQ